MIENLCKSVLFGDMSTESLAELLNSYAYRTKQFEKRDFVMLQNDLCDSLMILTEGSVQAQMTDLTGKIVIMDRLQTGDVLAPAFIFAKHNRMPVTLVAQEYTEVIYFKKEVFIKVMQSYETVLLNFLKIISDKSKFLSEKVYFHAFGSIKSKIAHYLYKKYNEQKTTVIQMKETQQELSEIFGVSRPALARSISEMVKEGLLDVSRKQWEIKDLTGLRQLIQ